MKLLSWSGVFRQEAMHGGALGGLRWTHDGRGRRYLRVGGQRRGRRVGHWRRRRTPLREHPAARGPQAERQEHREQVRGRRRHPWLRRRRTGSGHAGCGLEPSRPRDGHRGGFGRKGRDWGRGRAGGKTLPALLGRVERTLYGVDGFDLAVHAAQHARIHGVLLRVHAHLLSGNTFGRHGAEITMLAREDACEP